MDHAGARPDLRSRDARMHSLSLSRLRCPACHEHKYPTTRLRSSSLLNWPETSETRTSSCCTSATARATRRSTSKARAAGAGDDHGDACTAAPERVASTGCARRSSRRWASATIRTWRCTLLGRNCPRSRGPRSRRLRRCRNITFPNATSANTHRSMGEGPWHAPRSQGPTVRR